MSTETVVTNRQESSTALNVTLWLLQIAGAAMFFMAGFSKLSGDPQMVGLFDAIGVGQWFRYVTGGIEFGAAILLLIPRLAGVGALLLIPTMIGAILTHVFIVGGSFALPLALLAAMSVVALGRKDRTLSLVRQE